MGVPRQPGVVTSLSAAVAAAAGTAINADGRGSASMQIDASAVSTGGTVVLEGSLDGTTWARLTPKDGDAAGLAIANRIGTISATGTYIMEYENICALKLRANLLTRTDGTYTVQIRVKD
ncbi:MAG: hypothetical protein ACYTFI_00770 [Planctomycetota bacterium]|jgi:hypothetical protein